MTQFLTAYKRRARKLTAVLTVFTALLFASGCASAPRPLPLQNVQRVVVKGTASGGFFGEQGNNASAIGAAQQSFSEQLLKRGFVIVAVADGAPVPKDVTHEFLITVNQGSADSKRHGSYLNVEVSAEIVEAKSRNILWTHKERRVESSRNLGDIVRVVGELAGQLANEAPGPR